MSLNKTLLATLIASALASDALAQQLCEQLEGAPPGLYATTEEGRTFLVKDGEVVELGPGDAGYANEDGVKCIQRIPRFMDWPCATDAARSRMFATYTVDELETDNRAQEIVQRYFDVPEVIEPMPRWKEGEYHLKMSLSDIIQFATEEYWYYPDQSRPILDEKRPKVLQIALYVGINQVVVDGHTLNALAKHYGDEDIPVAFVFNDSNVVPISYFGSNVSLEEILKANAERGINVDDVPMWELGDHNLRPSVYEIEKYFDLPSLDEIPADKRAALEADIEAYGFSRKPLFISILGESNNVLIDQPQRARVAISMGYTNIPAVVTIIQPDVLVQRCGPGVPTALGEGFTISGETTPEGGATLPPANPVTPPPSGPDKPPRSNAPAPAPPASPS